MEFFVISSKYVCPNAHNHISIGCGSYRLGIDYDSDNGVLRIMLIWWHVGIIERM